MYDDAKNCKGKYQFYIEESGFEVTKVFKKGIIVAKEAIVKEPDSTDVPFQMELLKGCKTIMAGRSMPNQTRNYPAIDNMEAQGNAEYDALP